jgi:hypothetical protein
VPRGRAGLQRQIPQPHAVDEAALAAALRDNRIAGAAIDVGRALDQMPTGGDL